MHLIVILAQKHSVFLKMKTHIIL